jgi:hypothetical protein
VRVTGRLSSTFIESIAGLICALICIPGSFFPSTPIKRSEARRRRINSRCDSPSEQTRTLLADSIAEFRDPPLNPTFSHQSLIMASPSSSPVKAKAPLASPAKSEVKEKEVSNDVSRDMRARGLLSLEKSDSGLAVAQETCCRGEREEAHA